MSKLYTLFLNSASYLALAISVVSPLTVAPLIGGVSIAYADDLPGSAGGTGDTLDSSSLPDSYSAAGGKGMAMAAAVVALMQLTGSVEQLLLTG